MTYADIMDGKMFAEEITEMETPVEIIRTHKPVYFAGIIKTGPIQMKAGIR